MCSDCASWITAIPITLPHLSSPAATLDDVDVRTTGANVAALWNDENADDGVATVHWESEVGERLQLRTIYMGDR